MRVFSGFPDGKLQVTPLPNQFFSELCPNIDDLAELKVTLHLIWLFAQKRNRVQHVATEELRADQTLMRSLASIEAKGGDPLERGLALGVERGTLLRADRAGQALYFLNSESGRRAFERMTRGATGLPEGTGGHEPASDGVRSNIFELYEQNIGLLTPMLSEELKEAEREFPAEWIAEAFRIALENNRRSWSYVRKILERWKQEGRTNGKQKGKPWYSDEYGKFVKR